MEGVGMNVLSLFDGMSCGRIALERVGIPVTDYFASEIDKYAIQVSKHNWPEIKHIGSVLDVKADSLPKIDLLIGGSPCQGFSFAGKQLNFEDPRSKLFFEYVRLLNECKPTYFLLENVIMKQEYQDVISEHLGVKPIRINSALVSAQNRNRLYWTNIPNIEQPEDCGILLKDIIEDGFADLKGNQSIERVYSIEGKYPTLTTMGGGHREPKILCTNNNARISAISEDSRGFRPHRGDLKKTGISEIGRILKPEGDKTDTLTTSHAPKLLVSGSVDAGLCYRKLTPLECERLQTVPENYTACVSNSQRYKMLGNGWTVSVISHIFKGLLK